MAAPLMECREKFLDGLLFRPEVAVQDGQVGDRALSLLGDYLVQGGVGVEAVARIIGSVHLRAPHFEHTSGEPADLEPPLELWNGCGKSELWHRWFPRKNDAFRSEERRVGKECRSR